MFNNKKKEFKEKHKMSINEFEKHIGTFVLRYYTLRFYIEITIDLLNDKLKKLTDEEEIKKCKISINALKGTLDCLSDKDIEFNLFQKGNGRTEENINKMRNGIIVCCDLNYDLTFDCVALGDFCDIINVNPSFILDNCTYDRSVNHILGDIESSSSYFAEPTRTLAKEKMYAMAKERGIKQRYPNELDEMFNEEDKKEEMNNINNGGISI